MPDASSLTAIRDTLRDTKFWIAVLLAGVLAGVVLAKTLALPGAPGDWASWAEVMLLGVGLYSLHLLRLQLKVMEEQHAQSLLAAAEERKRLERERHYARIASYYQYFSDFPTEEINNQLHTIAESVGFKASLAGMGTPITSEQSQSIMSDIKKSHVVRTYLDAFESFAGAVLSGVIDNSFAYQIECARVLRTYAVFEPYICDLRSKNRKAYVELEKLRNRWHSDRLREFDNHGIVQNYADVSVRNGGN